MYSFVVNIVFFCFLVILAIGCNSKNIENNYSNNYIGEEYSSYQKIQDPTKKFTLNYKIEEQKNSPVKLIYFIVIRNSDTKIIKKDTIAGRNTLEGWCYTLRHPYKEVEKLQTLEEEPTVNEILIKI
jgi:hypothetical protein